MGIQISGVNGVDKIVATDGTIDVFSGTSISGVLTATSFTGNLTGDVTGNLTGNVNASSNLLLQIGGSEKFRVGSSGQLGIGGANYGTSGQVLQSAGSGAPPTWNTVSGTTINNNADNRVITGSGTANTLEGEANLTFSSNQLTVHEAKLKGNQLLFTTSGTAYLDHSTVGQDIQVRVSTSSSQDTTGPTFKSNGNLAFASGKGIDFSATANYGTSTPAELLDDYEEGQFLPSYSPASGSITMLTRRGEYCKVGRVVHCMFSCSANGSSSPSGTVTITGLPFTGEVPSANGPRGGGGVVFAGYHAPTSLSHCNVNGNTLYLFLNDHSYLQANTSGTGFGYNAYQISGFFSYLTTA